jgi:hypothetical protein
MPCPGSKVPRIGEKGREITPTFFEFFVTDNAAKPLSPLKTPQKNYKKKVHKRIDLSCDFDRFILHPETGGGRWCSSRLQFARLGKFEAKMGSLSLASLAGFFRLKIEEMESG